MTAIARHLPAAVAIVILLVALVALAFAGGVSFGPLP
jgi:CHASE1-domain containing sensor protein